MTEHDRRDPDPSDFNNDMPLVILMPSPDDGWVGLYFDLEED